ncbi:FadR family transcriptional regulator [Hwanghaeella grinnelliae]|uniref:FadR family transcriptional regulator n=1 Tax=Hwanghaeella grinnelliae TaxID=2500179 RepID=A0A437QHG4_9PROT|nr:FadR/GntR family transcriptional regulator [Hwanghaeella grinnelliae]RVU34013.1 FadR family transcriptional regulator [Hwanghaeella grinnelliae]
MTDPRSGAGELVRRLRPAAGATSLADQIVTQLRGQILSGRLQAGDKLPTEQELCDATGVSRPVVREAISRLKADGVIVSRQGVGVFIVDDKRRMPFRIEPHHFDDPQNLLSVMELRLCVEVEAAAMAAEKHSDADLALIDEALTAMKVAVAENGSAVEEDFAFHCAIAAATGNELIEGFLRFLGVFVIPRPLLRMRPENAETGAAYMVRLVAEHQAVRDAIAARDPEGAREAMRLHLERGMTFNQNATRDEFS